MNFQKLEITHPSPYIDELHSECAKDHLAGLYNSPSLPNLQCSGVGVIPKKDGSWHMIMHLSAPHLNTMRLINSHTHSTTVQLTMSLD